MSATYDRLSSSYDWLTVSERPFRREALDLLAAGPGETVFEIGCGTAQSVCELAAAVGSDGQAIGLDLSAGMLRQARRNVAKCGGTAVALLRGNGLGLPLVANSCDAVFLSFTLELFDLQDQHQLLAEVRRVVRPGGRLAVITLSTHARTAVSAAYWSLHDLFPALVDCRPIAAAPLLSAAGFQILQEERRSLFRLPLTIILATA